MNWYSISWPFMGKSCPFINDIFLKWYIFSQYDWILVLTFMFQLGANNIKKWTFVAYLVHLIDFWKNLMLIKGFLIIAFFVSESFKMIKTIIAELWPKVDFHENFRFPKMTTMSWTRPTRLKMPILSKMTPLNDPTDPKLCLVKSEKLLKWLEK